LVTILSDAVPDSLQFLQLLKDRATANAKKR